MQILLWPFSLVYGLIINIRNLLFHFGVLKEKKFSVPVISVGNLRVGGTGKSPHILFLANLLMNDNHVAILSRGYGRKSKGFRIVSQNDTAQLAGDEPLQYAQSLSKCIVAVDENRVDGIEKLVKLENPPAVILLDDAYQHRYVKPGLSILLTEYNRLYTKDRVLPSGRLREPVSSAKRADIIIITKCPENISKENKLKIISEIKPCKHQKVFFSYMRYREYLELSSGGEINIRELKNKSVLLLSGIENPTPLITFLQPLCSRFDQLIFPDHHPFTAGDLTNVRKKFDKFAEPGNGLIITTRKDYMRLQSKELKAALAYITIAIIDITVEIINPDNGQENKSFEQEIIHYVKSN